MLVKSELRKGSVYSSSGVKDFVAPIFKQYGSTHTCVLRGDSAFAKPELYDECESNNINYTIRLKRNNNLFLLAQDYCDKNRDWSILEEDFYYFIKYQAQSWSKERVVAVHSHKPEGELHFNHEYIATNFSCFDAYQIFRIYRNRGVMENSIKELKAGFSYDKRDSSSFIENEGRTIIAGLAYNLVELMKQLYFDDEVKNMTVNTLRLKLFKVAGKVVRHARTVTICLSSSHVFQKLFVSVSKSIRNTRLNC